VIADILDQLGLADVRETATWHLATHGTKPTRAGLERLARDAVDEAQWRPIPTKRELIDQRRTLSALQSALDELDQFTDTREGRDTRAGLILIVERAHRRVDMLENRKRDGRRHSAAKPWRFSYWQSLAYLAGAVSAAAGREVDYRLIKAFIVACSQPVLPAATTPRALTYFLQMTKQRQK
jgi:hypothetical protein